MELTPAGKIPVFSGYAVPAARDLKLVPSFAQEDHKPNELPDLLDVFNFLQNITS